MSLCTYCGRAGHSASSCKTRHRVAIPAIAAASLFMAACDKAPPPPSQITGPSARLMVPPTDPTAPKPGEDLVVKHLETVNQCVADNGRFRSLQRYVTTVRGAR